MKHLTRNSNYGAVHQALKTDSPKVAEAMTKMSDCVSAAIEIISNQLGDEHAKSPRNVLPLATEIFRSAKASTDPDVKENSEAEPVPTDD